MRDGTVDIATSLCAVCYVWQCRSPTAQRNRCSAAWHWRRIEVSASYAKPSASIECERRISDRTSAHAWPHNHVCGMAEHLLWHTSGSACSVPAIYAVSLKELMMIHCTLQSHKCRRPSVVALPMLACWRWKSRGPSLLPGQVGSPIVLRSRGRLPLERKATPPMCLIRKICYSLRTV